MLADASLTLRRSLLEIMQRGADARLSDDEFNRLAIAAFRHQFEFNTPYRRYCERRDVTPATVQAWVDIPAVPTAAFKELTLVAGAIGNAALAFKTSGTTRGSERRGVHYILDPVLYESSLLPAFERFVLRGRAPIRMLSLIPPSADQPDSSLSYMISVVVRELGSSDSRFFASARAGLDAGALSDALHKSSAAAQAVCLLGTSLAFAHLLASAAHLKHALPSGSRLMDTGGFKGEHQSYSAHELKSKYQRAFGIPPDLCINEYGMTELCSQYYDAQYHGAEAVKQGPPWLRARVVNPDTLAPMPRGNAGILQHFDLANLDSVCAVLTEDMAYETGDGFVLLGRAPGATPRGCSIAMDIMLSDSATRS